MKQLFLTGFFAYLFIVNGLYAQRETGLPFLRNYSPREYGASPQNWGIVQDSNGILYVANNTGVLEYDGITWRKIPVTNRSAVGSLAIDSQNVIYVGATGEFGYLKPDSAGWLKYVSLMPKIEARYHDFADVWHTHAFDGKVYFQSYKFIFCLDGDSVIVIRPDKIFHRSYVVNNRLYIRERSSGLVMLEKDSLIPVPGGDLFREEAVYSMIPYDQGKILVGTRRQNLFLFDNQSFNPFPVQADSFLASNLIYFGIRHGNEFVLSTRRAGVVVIDLQGNITRSLTRESGLMDESINSTYLDDGNGLWVVQNNGISRVEAFSPVSFFGENTGIKGIVLSSIRHENSLYVTTGLGVYVLYTDQANRRIPPSFRFEPVRPIAAQSWHLLSFGKSLLAGTSDGIYEIEGNKAKSVRKTGGGFFLYRSRRDGSLVFAGLRDGLACLRNLEGKWIDLGVIPGVHVDGRAIVESPDGYLWVGTSFRGVIRIDLRTVDLQALTPQSLKSASYPVKQFGTNDGLPYGGVFVFSAAGKLLFGTERGLYGFDSAAQRFMPDSTFGPELNDSTKSIDVITEDAQGNVWVHAVSDSRSENYLFKRLPYGVYQKEALPFLRFADYSVLHINPESDGVTWFGGADGLIRYDSRIPKDYHQPFRTLIRKVYIRRDSLVYGGHGVPPSAPVAFRHNSLRFECAAGFYEQPAANQYQYFMEGLDDNWSGWTNETNKEYNGLPEGSYRFHVRSKNIFGTMGNEAIFAFEILPPWYRAWWAYILYFLFFSSSMIWVIRWRALKLESEKLRLETIVRERTTDLLAKTEQLEKINAFVKTINSEIEPVRLVKALLSQLKTLKGTERLSSLAWDETAQSYQYIPADEGFKDESPSVLLTVDRIENHFIKNSREINPDIFSGTRTVSDDHGSARSGSFLIMRIRRHLAVQAYFVFENLSQNDAFDHQDIILLNNLRDHITLAFMKVRLLDELKRLNEKKNEFLGIAAHDLRSPLNVIVGFVSLIIDELKSDSFKADAGLNDLRDVLKAAKGMTHLLSELLDISAIESGKIVLNITPVHMSAIFDECARNHVKIAAQKNISLNFNTDESLPPVQADRVRVTEVLDNLISNAVKYTYPGGYVTVSANWTDNRVLISVNDTGQGLSEEDLKAVFHSYKKLSARPTGGESSTGLGLAIVKKIVEMHGGHVFVESVRGKGSTFSFTLN